MLGGWCMWKGKTLFFPLRDIISHACFNLCIQIMVPTPSSHVKGKNTYLLTTDDFSHFTWIYFSQYTWWCFLNLQRICHNHWQQIFNVNQTLRSDSGWEYMSTQFSSFLKEKKDWASTFLSVHFHNKMESLNGGKKKKKTYSCNSEHCSTIPLF